LRCSRCITLPHVALHRVKQSDSGPATRPFSLRISSKAVPILRSRTGLSTRSKNLPISCVNDTLLGTLSRDAFQVSSHTIPKNGGYMKALRIKEAI
jgi:hypothetical protein